jgi:hypothetical protein
MNPPPVVTAKLFLLRAVLALSGAAVFVVLVLRRRRPSRGFEVKRVLSLEQGDSRE